MSRVVLDSSALLALLNAEPGAEKLTPQLLSIATCSTVNLAEVHSTLVARGVDERDAWRATLYAINQTIDFTARQAQIAGDLVLQTRPLGLSLGDRACLALGIDLGVPVFTADRSWKKLHLPVTINIIR